MAKLTEDEREKLESVLAELNNYQALADVLHRQLSLLTASISELSASSETIKTLRKMDPNTEMLVSIGSDSFITAKLALQDKVVAGLGANVAVEKTVEEALQTFETRANELQKIVLQTRGELAKIGERVDALRPEAERLLAKAKEK